jgi:tetratricopeptide (TPR) repeat protein
MAGHIQRLRRNLDRAVSLLTRSFESGEPRGALGLGMLFLAQQKPKEAEARFSEFCRGGAFPTLAMDTLSVEACRILGDRLMELGQDVCPGFSRFPHDPAVWTAMEFYHSAFSARPEDAEAARALASLLMGRGATAEAMSVAQKGLEKNPGDPVLNSVFSEAGKASYLTLN